MYRILFSFLLGLTVLFLNFLPMTINAQIIGGGTLDTYQSATNPYYGGLYGSPYGTYSYPASPSYGVYGYPTSIYNAPYGVYGYNYPSYSSYSNYPVYSNPYGYPGYRAYYYNPGMYNPNTTFVNPPSSLNYRYGYPAYSETYLYR